MHWSGGVEEWQAEAATWQSLDRYPVTVLAVWEKQSERESIMQGLQGASLVERNSLQARLAALPQQGTSGVVGSWIEAIIRGHKSKCKILEFEDTSHKFKVEFEQWKIGESDPDDRWVVRLAERRIQLEFYRCAASSTRGLLYSERASEGSKAKSPLETTTTTIIINLW